MQIFDFIFYMLYLANKPKAKPKQTRSIFRYSRLEHTKKGFMITMVMANSLIGMTVFVKTIEFWKQYDQ